jgi:hypothetical protein
MKIILLFIIAMYFVKTFIRIEIWMVIILFVMYVRQTIVV